MRGVGMRGALAGGALEGGALEGGAIEGGESEGGALEGGEFADGVIAGGALAGGVLAAGVMGSGSGLSVMAKQHCSTGRRSARVCNDRIRSVHYIIGTDTPVSTLHYDQTAAGGSGAESWRWHTTILRIRRASASPVDLALRARS